MYGSDVESRGTVGLGACDQCVHVCARVYVCVCVYTCASSSSVAGLAGRDSPDCAENSPPPGLTCRTFDEEHQEAGVLMLIHSG